MTDTIGKKAREWFASCAQTLEEPPSCEESYIAGYQAAQADARALVGELEIKLARERAVSELLRKTAYEASGVAFPEAGEAQAFMESI